MTGCMLIVALGNYIDLFDVFLILVLLMWLFAILLTFNVYDMRGDILASMEDRHKIKKAKSKKLESIFS